MKSACGRKRPFDKTQGRPELRRGARPGGYRRGAAGRARSEGRTRVRPNEVINGAEGWNRTSDTSIFSAVLYRLSYLGLP